jgi:hypothetical protein
MKEILELIEGYGLPLILLLGRRHEDNAKSMEELKVSIAELKEKINTILEFIKK